jgi:hypothetical protein
VSVEPKAVLTASQGAVASLTLPRVTSSAAIATAPARARTPVKRLPTPAREDKDEDVSSLPSEAQVPTTRGKPSDIWLDP